MKTKQRGGSQMETLPMRLVDVEGERLVLSNMLARPEFCKAVMPQLEADHFPGDLHQRVFHAISDAIARGYEPGLAGVYRWLLDQGRTNADLGLPVLSELAWEGTFDLANPDPWIRSLHRHHAERCAWRAAEKLQTQIELGEAGALENAREELRRIETEMEGAPPTSGTIGDTLAAMDLNKLLAPPRGVIASPWPKLTEIVNGGPRPGELWIVGARPSVGKTIVLLQWGLTAAANGHQVMFFSLEMPKADLVRRAISSEGRIHHAPLQRGDLSAEWRRRVVETMDAIGPYPLEPIDTCRTLRSITARIASAASQPHRKPALVALDYLGLIESDERRQENRNQEVSYISRRMKTLAMDYGVPILAAHQLNRSSESESRRPALSDLRDSGSLEQDADVVLLLDSPASRTRHVSADAPPDAVNVLIAKQRNGPRNFSVQLRLEAQFCRLEEA
jgi:replicative DNA helicase